MNITAMSRSSRLTGFPWIRSQKMELNWFRSIQKQMLMKELQQGSSERWTKACILSEEYTKFRILTSGTITKCKFNVCTDHLFRCTTDKAYTVTVCHEDRMKILYLLSVSERFVMLTTISKRDAVFNGYESVQRSIFKQSSLLLWGSNLLPCLCDPSLSLRDELMQKSFIIGMLYCLQLRYVHHIEVMQQV